MARPEGLEPSTLGLEGRCSIQLSYERIIKHLPAVPGATSPKQSNTGPAIHGLDSYSSRRRHSPGEAVLRLVLRPTSLDPVELRAHNQTPSGLPWRGITEPTGQIGS